MDTVTRLGQVEYQTFIYSNWNESDAWCSLTDLYCDELAQAQEFFWRSHYPNIQNRLEDWQAQGWTLLETPDPSLIQVSKSIRYSFQIDPSDIFLWFVTCGVALLFQCLLGGIVRRYVTYRPLEFRIKAERRYEAGPTYAPSAKMRTASLEIPAMSA